VGDLVLSKSRCSRSSLPGNPRQCPCRQFNFDPYGDHIQTCHRQSTSLPTSEWIVYRLSLFLHSVGHRVKTHRITPFSVNERGDVEIKDYVLLPHGEDDRIPPRTLVMDVTMTHDRYGRTTQRTNGALKHRVSPLVSRSHTHPSHSQTSRLLTSSLSLGVPVPHVTQCR
jgi:hypothetical protein